MTVAHTGGIAGGEMRWKTCRRFGAIDHPHGLDVVGVLTLERGQQDDEHERRPLPDVTHHHRDPGAPGR